MTKEYSVVAFWVVARGEESGKILHRRSYATMKEAEVEKLSVLEMTDPPGEKSDARIEILPLGEEPKEHVSGASE
jgi:hypothetical protein